MRIRRATAEDLDAWLVMRTALWPDCTGEKNAAEARQVLESPQEAAVFLACDSGGGAVGFAEFSLRRWAEGCDSSPVGYLEGWYVEAAARRRGVGAQLLAAGEEWARAAGCREMASDADPQNVTSRSAHARLGFEEVGEAVLFRKGLAEPAP